MGGHIWTGGFWLAVCGCNGVRSFELSTQMLLLTHPPCPPTLPLRQLLELDVALDQAPKYSALDKWAQQVQSLHTMVVAKLAV